MCVYIYTLTQTERKIRAEENMMKITIHTERRISEEVRRETHDGRKD